MKNKRWYFRSYRKLACQFVFLPSEWYHVFLNKNNSWKISNKRKSLSVFFHEMCVYWAALLWTLPALATREDVTRSPWMSGTNTGLGMSSTSPGIQVSSTHRGLQGMCSQGNWWSCLSPSSAQIFMPCVSTFQRRQMKNWWTLVRFKPNLEEKNINFCRSQRMKRVKRVKTYHL